MSNSYNIRFTETEFEFLLQMVLLSNLIADQSEDPSSQVGQTAFNELHDKILKFAYEKTPYSGLLDYDENEQSYEIKPAQEACSFYYSVYEELRENSFWEELVVRLADRDLIRKIGLPAWEKLTEEQRRTQTARLEATYWKEFEKTGVDRLELLFPPQQG